VHDDEPGIRREGSPKRFRYVDARGERVRHAATLARIRALVIPPAWTDVWICSQANGHVQATGRDARGRKQYRYHARWSEQRGADKYARMLAFGEALGRIRAQTAKDLALAGLPREKVLATVVRLLEITHARIGNEEYAKQNKSYGLTTLTSRHVDVSGPRISLRFRGKSGKSHALDVRDATLAKVVRRCEELPGQRLFEYLDDDGSVHPVGSHDVNEYIRAISGGDFTAKDFRTLAGTVLAARALREQEPCASKAQLKRAVRAALEVVSSHLGNTIAVCRKSYVHPAVLDAYERSLLGTRSEDLVEEEEIVFRLLRKIARGEARGASPSLRAQGAV
jgi:DNA topoisomerase-1